MKRESGMARQRPTNAQMRPREEAGLAACRTVLTTAMSPALLTPLKTPVMIARITIVREYLVMNEINFIWTSGPSCPPAWAGLVLLAPG